MLRICHRELSADGAERLRSVLDRMRRHAGAVLARRVCALFLDARQAIDPEAPPLYPEALALDRIEATYRAWRLRGGELYTVAAGVLVIDRMRADAAAVGLLPLEEVMV